MPDYAPKPSCKEVVDFAMRFGDKVVWAKVLGKKDAQSLLCRDLFTYALVLREAQNVLYEAEKKLERVPVLLKRAQQMQNLSEESATYGNWSKVARPLQLIGSEIFWDKTMRIGDLMARIVVVDDLDDCV